ncbi:MAG: prepilin-type N-terminal cleavage/methylation domain-containing protein [Candidatus Cloacimonadaceae bacterium]|jgi:prepilin-type N-terminal cleavage/methylation domain-containing protein|nr:prepilin-type N-terminal cleavage/methylation domain-containing protein [Candidatus Cloacimonadota bacterium]MCB5258224.1 prepilin-type N-terminal cleavage/methylation domain-containing protein [Candidatus Cloacimonadota bacterium]MDD5625081.1 prepilin-type N-terminal cleavage/methylation domain-containing protein [Candidatus Cloacimonadota bacterium]
MKKHKASILAQQSGFTLIELIVVMVISVLLLLISGLGIGTFFRTYKELTAWTKLQQDALNCLNLIKNGVPVGPGSQMEYIGVTNAVTMELTNTTTNVSTGLKITPPSSYDIYKNDYAHFYLYDGAVRCTYIYHGVQAASPLYIFPAKEDLDDIIIDKFKFTKVNPEQNVYVVQVELDARVKTGADRYRMVKFKTKMAKK